MKKYLMMLVLFVGLGQAALALALTLDEAKSQGLVGEKLDGYIAAVVAAPSAEVRALVTSTNDGRRKVYADLAQRNGITLEAVGVLSGEKLQTAAPMGQYIQMPDGKWRRK
jgi:uncharacterized protein